MKHIREEIEENHKCECIPEEDIFGPTVGVLLKQLVFE